MLKKITGSYLHHRKSFGKERKEGKAIGVGKAVGKKKVGFSERAKLGGLEGN